MRFLDRCQKAVCFLLFVVLLPASAYIFYGALDTLEGAGALLGLLHGKLVPLALLAASFLLCMAFLGLGRVILPWLERHGRMSDVCLFGGMALLQVLTVLFLQTSLRHDHLKIFDTAIALLDGGSIADTHFHSYFMKYPNNIPLCLLTYHWLRLLSFLGIPKGFFLESVKLLNLMFMDLGLWCGYSILSRCRSRRTGLIFLLLTLADPLWYLLGEMYYTSTISLAFSMGAMWLFESARRTVVPWRKFLRYFFMGILLAVGYKIRATVILTAAALVIYAMLEQRDFRWPQEALSLLAVALGAALAFAVFWREEQSYTGFDSSKTGYPAVHWIMMSAQGDGQYNSADDAYTGSFGTKAERTKADLALLKERVEEMGPDGLMTLFRNKLRVAFSDGTDDCFSLFRTMRRTSPMQKYINGARGDYLAGYLHSFHGMLMGLVLLAFSARAFGGGRSLLDVSALNICGAYLFYLIWEVDRAYSIPFMLMFLMWAADGLERLGRAFGRLEARVPSVRRLPAVSAAGLMLMAAGIGAAVRLTGFPIREYSVLQDQETGSGLTLQEAFIQTFRTGRPFDHVELWVANWDGAANDSIYDLQILDEDGRVVAKGEIVGAAAPCIDAYPVAFGKVVPKREQTYTLKVTLRNPDCAVKIDFLYYGTGVWDMYEDGALYAPDEVEDVDLAFAVYEEIKTRKGWVWHEKDDGIR